MIKQKTYPDSYDGALELLNDLTDVAEKNGGLRPVEHGVRIIPDPQVKGVWLALVSEFQCAFITYNFDADFEEVEWESAMKQYNKLKNW